MNQFFFKTGISILAISSAFSAPICSNQNGVQEDTKLCSQKNTISSRIANKALIPFKTYAEQKSLKPRSLSPWIERKDGVLVYKFNVFNLDESNVSQKKVKKIFKGILADSWKNYAKDYAVAGDFRVYSGNRISDPRLFTGDRIPLFIGNFTATTGEFLGFHAIQTPPDYGSFYILNNNIGQVLGITIPSNFPDFTPYAAVNSGTIKEWLGNGHWAGNPYAFNQPSDFYDFLSTVCSHEVHEAFGDDEIQNWVVFDNFAPTVANWRYLILDADGNPTNGTIGLDGYVHLPLFIDQFPDGFQATIVQENGDAVNRSTAAKLDSYKISGHPYRQANYPTSNFWKPYYVASDLKYDHNGLAELPCQPYAGLHEPFLVYILDLGAGLFGPANSEFAQVLNWGPVTSTQRQAEQQANNGPGWSAAANNFPPDYTMVSFFGPIAI